MKALCWFGKHDVRVEKVPDPSILNPRDAVIKITATAICGSDLHLYNNFIPTLEKGDILGHEFMGEVVELGSEVKNIKVGDRVVVPFTISCGGCFFCKRQMWSLCDNSNPNAGMAETLYGFTPSGLFGYSHMLGGYAGGQAEYVRVPFADVGPFKVPDGISDEQALFLSDILPTGYEAADNCNIQPGDTVAVWGCGPVGLFAIKSACLLGAEQVIAIDRMSERLRKATAFGATAALNFEEVDVPTALREITANRGPDSCIDAVGMEAHGLSVDNIYDRIKQLTGIGTDRPHVLRQAIMACRKGGTISMPGVYGGLLDKIPMGAAHAKSLTFKMGQTFVQKYMPVLMDHIQQGKIDPSAIITHRMKLDDAAHGYEIFNQKYIEEPPQHGQPVREEVVKVVLKP